MGSGLDLLADLLGDPGPQSPHLSSGRGSLKLCGSVTMLTGAGAGLYPCVSPSPPSAVVFDGSVCSAPAGCCPFGGTQEWRFLWRSHVPRAQSSSVEHPDLGSCRPPGSAEHARSWEGRGSPVPLWWSPPPLGPGALQLGFLSFEELGRQAGPGSGGALGSHCVSLPQIIVMLCLWSHFHSNSL